MAYRNTRCLLTIASLLALLPLNGYAQSAEAEQSRQSQPAEMMPLADQAIINDISRAGERLVAVGERGHVLVSDDGGQWQQVAAPTRAMLTRVVFVDAEHGWAVGHDGAVLTTADGGDSWELRHFDAAWGKPFYDALFQTPESGLVIGANGRMLRTDDAGASWTEVTNEVFDTGFNLYEIERLHGGTLLIAGERGFLARSLDDGQSWEMLEPPYIGSYFGVLPTGDQSAILFGLQGRVFEATDVRALATLDDPFSYDPFINESVTDPSELSNMGWRRFDNPEEESLFGGAIYDDARVVLVGVDGTIMHGRSDSTALEVLESPTGAPISDVVVRDGELLMGGRGGFYRRDLP